MKKSGRVTLTVVAAAALAACSRRRDPCQTAAFDEQACREAVVNRGYYWHGSWVPMTYSYPYFYYYDHYRTHVSGGGSVRSASPGAYGRPGAASSGAPTGGSTSHGVERGGFGSTGAGHSAGE